MRALRAAHRGGPLPPTPPGAPDLEVVMRHFPIKRRWQRHWRCGCGRYLDRCTEYWRLLARGL